MATELEEIQAKEFLKRAEIRTMKKDLRALREFDALKERDKIAKIKTLEEQRLEHEKQLRELEEAKLSVEKTQREKILGENSTQERLAEKDLKQYATEQERQQIFLFESQRLSFEKKVEEIDSKKDPALKLEKNKILLERNNWKTKLDAILEQEKKLEEEQGFITEKSQTSTIASEKKSLEQRRWELEEGIKEIEKKRWEIEKAIENINAQIVENDKSSETLVAEKNDLNQKILGVDKSLREIYSEIVARVEGQRAGKLEEQKLTRETLAKSRLIEKENVQREQWKPAIPVKKGRQKEKIANNIVVPGDLSIPVPIKKKAVKISEEEVQRKKFTEKVENWAEDKNKKEQSQNLMPPKKI
jgi:uncharacterized coiled-coil protein SlyX